MSHGAVPGRARPCHQPALRDVADNTLLFFFVFVIGTGSTAVLCCALLLAFIFLGFLTCSYLSSAIADGLASEPLVLTSATTLARNRNQWQNHRHNLFLNRVPNPRPQCVKLSKFETEHAISFIPPDGEHELMRCSSSTNSSSTPPLLLHPGVKLWMRN